MESVALHTWVCLLVHGLAYEVGAQPTLLREDMKDEQIKKREHETDIFEVTPTNPRLMPPQSQPPLLGPHQLPLASSLLSVPSGWLHHAILAGGLCRVQ